LQHDSNETDPYRLEKAQHQLEAVRRLESGQQVDRTVNFPFIPDAMLVFPSLPVEEAAFLPGPKAFWGANPDIFYWMRTGTNTLDIAPLPGWKAFEKSVWWQLYCFHRTIGGFLLQALATRNLWQWKSWSTGEFSCDYKSLSCNNGSSFIAAEAEAKMPS